MGQMFERHTEVNLLKFLVIGTRNVGPLYENISFTKSKRNWKLKICEQLKTTLVDLGGTESIFRSEMNPKCSPVSFSKTEVGLLSN